MTKVAAYLRLSREDGDKIESDSITNQRSLIQDYLGNKSDMILVDEFVDDGVSGTTFERPAFTKMIEAAKRKQFDCIIVKDLSRFGRNYISYEDYLEIKEHYVSEEENIAKEIQETDSQIWKKRKAVKKFLDWAEKLDMNGLENPELEQKLFDELISEIYISDNMEVEIVFHCSDMLAEINEMLGE